MAIVLFAIVTLLPLILTPYLLFYYDVTPKIGAFLIATAIAIPLAMREKRAVSAGLRIFEMLLLLQAVSLALSTVFSTDPGLSLGGSAWRRFGLLTQLGLLIFAWIAAQWTAGAAGRARRLLRALVIAGIPAAGYGICQYFGWDPLINPAAYHIGEAPLTIVRPPATLGYVSYFATYLLSVIFFGAILIICEEARAWKLLGAAGVLLGTSALILTGTRAAMLGWVCGALFLALWLRPKLGRRELIAAAVALTAIVVFYFSPAGQPLRSRTRWFLEDPLGGARLLLWRDSLRMAAVRWTAGFGPETFSIHFPLYRSAELARAYPDFYQESPHNIFVDALVSQGVLGLAGLLGVTALGFYAVSMIRDRKLAAGLGAGLVAVLVSQEFTSFTLPTAVFFYLTLALVVAQAFLPVRCAPVRNRTGANACATVLSVVLSVYALALLGADARLAKVDRLIQAGKPREAAAAYQQLQRWQPPGMRTDLWYARAMAEALEHNPKREDQMFAVRQAMAAAVRASRNAEERQNAWLNLAFFYGVQNDSAHAEQSLRMAISSAPNWYKPHWLLAQVLRVNGRLQEARAEATLAAGLDGGKHTEVTRTAREVLAAQSITKK
ncbi:MAG TPA: O-antigen ligase family protein [Bryobacteraceae bacterium]|nr:O-antigen ligase family protein [Bryobacteraceae bacterium]